MMNQKARSPLKIRIRSKILEWNSKYPIDFIWRKKYGVAFGSQEHRQMSFIEMLFDIEEEIFMRNLSEIENNKEEQKSKMSEKQIDDLFDDIDIDDLDKYNINKKDK